MDIAELKQRLELNIDRVVRELLPYGKKARNEWCVGNIHGEPGSSLRVHLGGSKPGVWSDFQTGASGDIIDLWGQVKGLDLKSTLAEVKQYLGVTEPIFHGPKKKDFTRPVKPKCTHPTGTVLEYLTVQRGLYPECLEVFQVGCQNDSYVLPFKRDNELLIVKWIGIKRDEKGKKFVRVDGKEHTLFGWHTISDEERELFITEGEIDAMTLGQMGYPAVSVPFGAGSGSKHQWIENDWERLERFDTIYIVMDNDEAGKPTAIELANRLGLHRCRIITLPSKDANQLLLDNNKDGIATKAVFEQCIRDSKMMDPEELRNASTYRDDVVDYFHPANNEPIGLALPWKGMDLVRLRPGEISLWTGTNGHGKSENLGQVILEAMAQGQRACVFSGELTPKKLLGRLTRQAGKTNVPSVEYIHHIHDWYDGRLWVFAVTGNAKRERILEVFNYAWRRYGITFFVIDSLLKCGIAEDDYNTQKLFVEQLCDFKNEREVHVALVAHPKKLLDDYEMAGKNDVRGTGSITNLIDTGFTVWRNKKKEEKLKENPMDPDYINRPDAILECWKQREDSEGEGKLCLSFDRYSHLYASGLDDGFKRYVEYSQVTPEMAQI